MMVKAEDAGSDLRTEFFSSVVQWPRNVAKTNGSANCHGAGVFVDRDRVEVAEIDFNPVMDCTQTC